MIGSHLAILILDGYSEHVAHERRKMGLFGEKKSDLLLIQLDPINCLSDQITDIGLFNSIYILADDNDVDILLRGWILMVWLTVFIF